MMAPLIAPPSGPLLRGLTVLDEGERWLVEPRERRVPVAATTLAATTSRCWTPGVRVGVTEGSWFHQTECFGPVLGVMRADDLAHAVRLQNGTPFGLTGGIQSLDDDEIRHWLDHVEVGNAYVNRHITGAIVRRQPFGGWKRSSIGGAPKAGGPHYVHALLRSVPVAIDVAAAAASYQVAWNEQFADGYDATGLRSEANVLRHLPVAGVVVRIGDDTPDGAGDAAVAAARQCGVDAGVSDARRSPNRTSPPASRGSTCRDYAPSPTSATSWRPPATASTSPSIAHRSAPTDRSNCLAGCASRRSAGHCTATAAFRSTPSDESTASATSE